MPDPVERVHGTAIAVAGFAALLRGPSGSGKSDLALRCLMQAPSAIVPAAAALVADDQVELHRDGDQVIARSPDVISGKLEVRGIGICDVPAVRCARLMLVVDLVAPGTVERLPALLTPVLFFGIMTPRVELVPFEVSAGHKLMISLWNHGQWAVGGGAVAPR